MNDKNKSLSPIVTRHHSTSNIVNSELQSSNKRILLLDRDGVINVSPGKGKYVYHWPKFQFIPSTLTALKKLAQRDFEFVIISNQSGIGRGIYSIEQVNQLHELMVAYLNKENIIVNAIYYCPHHPEDECSCRKPNAGMFFQLATDYQINVEQLVYVGDDVRDVIAAHNAGCSSAFIGDNRQLMQLKDQPDMVASSAEQLVDAIEAHYQ